MPILNIEHKTDHKIGWMIKPQSENTLKIHSTSSCIPVKHYYFPLFQDIRLEFFSIFNFSVMHSNNHIFEDYYGIFHPFALLFNEVWKYIVPY